MQVRPLYMVPTTGGIRLATDVYLPDGPGPLHPDRAQVVKTGFDVAKH